MNQLRTVQHSRAARMQHEIGLSEALEFLSYSLARELGLLEDDPMELGVADGSAGWNWPDRRYTSV